MIKRQLIAMDFITVHVCIYNDVNDDNGDFDEDKDIDNTNN